MKYILLNLKRFDIPVNYGGVNSLSNIWGWGSYIVRHIQKDLKKYKDKAVFFIYLPEAHLIGALSALSKNSKIIIGCQSVYREDTEIGGNFGAFTSNRTANAMKAIGCKSVIIGHSEERRDKSSQLKEAGVTDKFAIDRILNLQIKSAIKAGLHVLYCIGEELDEKSEWKKVLENQILIGLKGIDQSKITIGYEPVWAIGPNKIAPNRDYIQSIAKYIKSLVCNVSVIYGGGLKIENATMLSSIPEIDGGLIALTRFTGKVGFYPKEFLKIVNTYMEGINDEIFI